MGLIAFLLRYVCRSTCGGADEAEGAARSLLLARENSYYFPIAHARYGPS